MALAPDGMRSPEDKKHDRFHLKLSILCIAVATWELLEAIDGKGRTEWTVIKSLKALLEVICGDKAQKVSAIDSSVDWKRAIAPEVLSADKVRYPRLFRFVENEILPWIKLCTRLSNPICFNHRLPHASLDFLLRSCEKLRNLVLA